MCILQTFGFSAAIEVFAWLVGLVVMLYCIFGTEDASDRVVAAEGFIVVIPDILFWVYGAYVYFTQKFGHPILQAACVFYAVIMILMGVFLLVMIVMVKAGKYVFNEPGAKKAGIIGVFEDYVHEHLMIALPFFVVFVFHKVIFMIYYMKRYV